MVVPADNRKVVVITDAASGIGPALVQNICTTTNAILYITSSNKKSGDDLIESLKAEGLTPKLRIVDFANVEEIRQFACELKKCHGGLDVLVANCKKHLRKSNSISLDEAEEVIKFNFFNVANALIEFLPLMRAHGRVVLCTTHPGVHHGREFLRDAPPEQTDYFRGSDVSLEGVRAGIRAYLSSVGPGTPWTPQVDVITTLGLYALVQMTTRTLEVEQDVRSLLINVGSFGWLRTAEGLTYLDAKGDHKGEIGVNVETAAADVLWLAKLPRGTKVPNGLMVRERLAVKWKQ